MWSFVVPEKSVPAELETSYLHLKTNSSAGSRDEAVIEFWDEWKFAGGIGIGFYSPAEYRLLNCQGNSTTFQKSLPTVKDKHWMIKKRDYRMVILCNGVQVLDLIISDKTCDKQEYADTWAAYWSRKATRLKFQSGDTASDFYHIG